MPILTIESGPQKGHRLMIRPPGPVFFGRDLGADFPLFDRTVSRRHFRIDFRDEGYRLGDLGSRSGTLVNGARVRSVLLNPGDRILAGNTAFAFEWDRPQDPLLGRDVAGYKILECVGTGGMGTVYRALQRSLRRIVALKVLSESLAEDPEFCRQFVEEARAAAEIAHPHVVRVYDVDLAGDVLFYAMEFMARGSVRDLCAYRGPLPISGALEIAIQACLGLECAHRKGIVHRDVKPANLLIHESGAVKIADLGIARRLAERAPTSPAPGLSGSPHYLSPEQALGRETDPRSDVYSLGATLFEMLAGRPPFVSESAKDLLLAHVRDRAPDVRSFRPEVPGAIAAIVMACLEKKPENRPQSASALAELLADAREEVLRAPRLVPQTAIRRWTRRGFHACIVGLWAAAGIGVGHIVRHLERKVRERKRRLDRIRGILEDTRELLQAGDAGAARRKFSEISRIHCEPEDWEALRPEIDRVEALLRAEEARGGQEGGLK